MFENKTELSIQVAPSQVYRWDSQIERFLHHTEAPKAYMNPHWWVQFQPNDIPNDDLLSCTQAVVRGVLNDYLNGVMRCDDDNKHWLSRYVNYIRPTAKERLTNVVPHLTALFERYEAALSSLERLKMLLDRPNISSSDVALFLTEWYRSLPILIERLHSLSESDCQQLALTPIIPEEYALVSRLRIVLDLKRYVKQHLSSFVRTFLIHGSIATLDYTGYSDLDTWVLVNQETVTDANKLQACRSCFARTNDYLYAFDPTQHHPLFIIAESELQHYPEAFLPVSALKLAKSLYCDRSFSLEVHCQQVKLGEQAAFWQSVQFLRRNTIQQEPQNTMYACKYYLSVIQLLPAFYYMVSGRPCNKRDSLCWIEDLLSGKDLESLRIATQLRSSWPTPGHWAKLSWRLMGTLISDPGFRHHFRRRIMGVWEARHNGSQYLNQHFYRQSLAFAEALLSRAYESGCLGL